MPSDTLTIPCPAKVNLALSVGAPRAGDGLHPICSWMVTVDFADTLTLSPAESGGSTFDIQAAEDAPQPIAIDWPIEQDLAYRAHALLEQHTGQALPVAMRLVKRIPSGAGLGGGSSDAAGVLVGLDRLFGLGLSQERLVGLGMELGSDVGFMTAARCGSYSAIVGGVGEQIEPVKLSAPLHLVLILPALHCATAEVYRCFDRSTAPVTLDCARVRELTASHPVSDAGPFNDLANPACTAEPRLRVLRDQIATAIGRQVHVSGSGAAMFALASSREQATGLAGRITSTVSLPTVVATTLF